MGEIKYTYIKLWLQVHSQSKRTKFSHKVDIKKFTLMSKIYLNKLDTMFIKYILYNNQKLSNVPGKNGKKMLYFSNK